MPAGPPTRRRTTSSRGSPKPAAAARRGAMARRLSSRSSLTEKTRGSTSRAAGGHSSAHDLEFDDLFRRHLRNVYRLLQKPAPDELFVSNISTAGAPAQIDPAGFIGPTLDGEETSYFEWLGAGAFEVRDVGGAMHQADHQPPVLTLIRFGFDRQRLYVRLEDRKSVV